MQFESFSMNVFFFEGRASSFFFFKKHNFLPLGKKWGGVGERYEYVWFFSTRSTISRIQTLHNQKWNSRSLWMRKKNKKRRTHMSVSINFGEKKGKQKTVKPVRKKELDIVQLYKSCDNQSNTYSR